MKELELSVVIPCLNEIETIGFCIEKIQRVIKEQKIDAEIVISDNGSTDGSIDFCQKQEMVRVVHAPKRGYGEALKHGISNANGKYAIFADADDSYDFLEIPKFLKELRSGKEFVIGCRLPKGGGTIKKDAMPFLHQYLGTPVLTRINNLLFNNKFNDCNCGMRGITKEAFFKMKLRCSGMEFASEMISKAGLLQLNSVEVPITLYKDKRSRPPHLRTWRDGWRHLKFMLSLSPGKIFQLPGILLLLIGLTGVGLTGFSDFQFQGIHFSTNTLMASFTLVLLAMAMIFTNIYVRHLYPDEFNRKGKEHIAPDTYIFSGLFLFVASIVGLSYLTYQWSLMSFGNIDDVVFHKAFLWCIFLIIYSILSMTVGFFMEIIKYMKN